MLTYPLIIDHCGPCMYFFGIGEILERRKGRERNKDETEVQVLEEWQRQLKHFEAPVHCGARAAEYLEQLKEE